MSRKAKWYRVTVAVLPPDGEELPTETALSEAIGRAFGEWSLLYGLRIEPIKTKGGKKKENGEC